MGVFAEQYCRRLDAGRICLSSNVLMAPLSGYTDAAFRLLAERYGAGAAFTEMVYVEDLLSGKPRAAQSARVDERETVKAVQLIGKDPLAFRRLCEGSILEHADWIDINMGCAVPEIVRSGRGCALVRDLPLASKIIEACKLSGKVVSVKCRPGMGEEEKTDMRAFARMCEDSGADLLTVHGRPGNRMHDGGADYEVIASAKLSVDIPVIGNGGIFSEEDAVEMMRQTGADGVMIGRGGIENPRIFSVLTGAGM